MLTLAQISSIVLLLLSFGVPQKEADNVYAILANSILKPQEVVVVQTVQPTYQAPVAQQTYLPASNQPALQAATSSMPDTVTTKVVEGLDSSSYTFTNNTGASISYSTATIKLWKGMSANPLPKKVSVEFYLGDSLVSSSYKVDDNSIPDVEVNALSIDLPLTLTITKNKSHNLRIETHPDNQYTDSNNRYYTKLVSLQ